MKLMLAPVCSPCGHVMQPVARWGDRTLIEKAIGGQPTALWFGPEFECVSCRTRIVLPEGPPFRPGSVGFDSMSSLTEILSPNPAHRHISAEHLPADARTDVNRRGAPLPLSQRQQAAGILDAFWATDGAEPMVTLDALSAVLGVDVPERLQERAEAIMALALSIDAEMPTPSTDYEPAPRDAEGRIIVPPTDPADRALWPPQAIWLDNAEAEW